MVDLVSLQMALVPRIYLDFALLLLLVFFTLSSFFFLRYIYFGVKPLHDTHMR